MKTAWILSLFSTQPGDDGLVLDVELEGIDVPALLDILGGKSKKDLRYMIPVTDPAKLERLSAYADFPLDMGKYVYYVDEVQISEGRRPT